MCTNIMKSMKIILFCCDGFIQSTGFTGESEEA